MNTIRTILILGLIFIITNTGYSQIIDNYGIRIGTGLANQYWKYKNDMFSDLSEWKDNRVGF